MSIEHPHLTMRPVGPKGPGRLWTCAYEGCTEPGPYNELAKRDCIEPPPPPCEWCGKTPECDLNCMGIKVLLADSDVHVVGELDAAVGEETP